ncbi:MAG: acyltransferase [Eubacteriales bacterium]|nr:acyltransferase [Eubacteriales bacterium]
MEGEEARAVRAPLRRSRVREWDVLRSMAFAAVVLQHLLGACAQRSGLGPAGQAFCAAAFEPLRFAVPMFVFLFGCSLFYANPQGVRYGAYLKKRLFELALPYAVWTVIYMRFMERPIGPRALLRSLLLGEGGYHLWYVVMILQFVVLTPVFFWVKKQAGAHPVAAMAVLLLLWLLYLGVTPHWDGGGLAGAVFYRHRSLVFLSWIGFFALGVLCGACRERFSHWTKRLFPLTGLIYGGSVVWAAYWSVRGAVEQGAVNFSRVGFLNPDYALFTLCGLLFWYECARRLAGWDGFARLCAFVGAHSYEAYLAHVLILTKASMFLDAHWSGMQLPRFYIILTAAALLGSVLLGWLIDSAVKALRAQWKRRGKDETNLPRGL